MTKFKGITNEYRATDEYKEMMNLYNQNVLVFLNILLK